jgi:uncharacterized protein (DUF2164 family)
MGNNFCRTSIKPSVHGKISCKSREKEWFWVIKKIPKEQKDDIVSNIQLYFSEERNESLGNLEAEQILNFVLQQVGPFVYNQALSDLRKVIQQQFSSLEDETYALEKPMECGKKRGF